MSRTACPSSSDIIDWENLESFTSERGWHLLKKNDSFLEWIKIPSQDLCNGQIVVQEIKIFKGWTFVVRVNNRIIRKETLVIKEIGPSMKCISYLFQVVDRLALCKGFPMASKVITRDNKGNVTGVTEEWHNDKDGVALFHRSVACGVVNQVRGILFFSTHQH